MFRICHTTLDDSSYVKERVIISRLMVFLKAGSMRLTRVAIPTERIHKRRGRVGINLSTFILTPHAAIEFIHSLPSLWAWRFGVYISPRSDSLGVSAFDRGIEPCICQVTLSHYKMIFYQGNRHVGLIIAFISHLFISTSATPLSPDKNPPLDSVTLQGVSFGEGCPIGSLGWFFPPEATSLSVILDYFITSSNPAVPASGRRATCLVSASFAIPSGYRFALSSTTIRGYTSLDQGYSISYENNRSFANSTQQV